MIIKFIGALLLLAAPYKVLSQQNKPEIQEPKLSLRFNFLGLIDGFDYNLTLGVERRFHPNWSAGTDAGWIFYSNYIQNTKGSNGFILRPFIRYYPRMRNSFWEAELHYKYVSYKIEDWIGRAPVNNVPAYSEYTTFNLNKYAWGFHLKWGLQANLSRDKRFKFEFSTGLGLRFKRHNVPGGVYNSMGVINNITNDTYVGAVIPLTGRLVYVLK